MRSGRSPPLQPATLPPVPVAGSVAPPRLSVLVVALAAVGAGCEYDVFGGAVKPTSGIARAAAAPAPTAAAPSVAALPGTPPPEHWHAVAHCETGGRWDNPGPTYVGGESKPVRSGSKCVWATKWWSAPLLRCV